MTHDPIRLLDDVATSAALRRDLAAAARHRVPYDAAAGAARLEASLSKGAGAASSGWGAGTLGLGALILGGLITAGAWLAWPATPVEPPAAVTSGSGGAGPQFAPAELPVIEDTSERTGPKAQVAPEEVAPPMPVVAPPVVAATPEEVVQDRSEETAPKPAKKPTKSRRGERAAEVVGHESSAPADSSDYLREARSLQAARGFLGRDPGQALSRAEAGAAEFKAGAFGQEWEGLAILALFELDRRAEAEQRAQAFLAKYPKGPYSGQVREALDRP